MKERQEELQSPQIYCPLGTTTATRAPANEQTGNLHISGIMIMSHVSGSVFIKSGMTSGRGDYEADQ